MSLIKYKKSGIAAVFFVLIIIFASSILTGDDTETIVSFDPSSQTVGFGNSFSVDVYCIPNQQIKAYELTVLFDASVLQAQTVTEGNIFDGYTTFFNSGIIDNTEGNISEIYGLIVGNGFVSDPGTLVTIDFIAEEVTASSALDLVNVGITNESSYVSVSLIDGVVQVDSTSPVIVDDSEEQGYTGDFYSFGATVTDNIDGSENLTVKVDWSHGGNSGNVSMAYMGSNYFSRTVSLDPNSVSDLSYQIYAMDSYGNSINTQTENVPVYDNDAPQISGVSASPNPQSIAGFVNISADVVDNIEIDEVYLDIIYPNSFNENFTITQNKTGNTYFCKKQYSAVGFYTYSIWAVDTSGFGAVTASYNFQIKDITDPIISNINIVTSSPLDTNPSYGWVNISCEVTDNIAVNKVCLNSTNPNLECNNCTMSSAAGNIYYHNSSIDFSTCGNYSYFIWANDSSENSVLSSLYIFSMPPNWDINMDGSISLLDLILISNYYGDKGSPGWTREDVDNNGTIEVIDLVFVSNHHGEIWWV